MVTKISSRLDSIADNLESMGFIREAFEIDKISDALESQYDKIEKQLEEAYKRHAPQDQIDRLETELAKYVNEGDLDVSEEDMTVGVPAASEGHSIDEELIELYHQYLHPEKSVYDRQELIKIMRGAIEERSNYLGNLSPKKNLTDTQILEAAKDVYDNHKALRLRKKNPNRINRTPDEALKNLNQIKERLKIV